MLFVAVSSAPQYQTESWHLASHCSITATRTRFWMPSDRASEFLQYSICQLIDIQFSFFIKTLAGSSVVVVSSEQMKKVSIRWINSYNILCWSIRQTLTWGSLFSQCFVFQSLCSPNYHLAGVYSILNHNWLVSIKFCFNGQAFKES